MGSSRPIRDDELFIVVNGARLRAERAVCEHCGENFLRRLHVRPGTGRYCSRICARSRKLDDRFWPKVQQGDGCWEWQGSRDKSGYGIIGASRHQRARRAHRVSWELHNGRSVPDGLDVLHHCDNKPCVNPAHLYVGTDLENARDAVERGRLPSRQGRANPNAKLTRSDVEAIIAAVTGGETQTAVARRFGISQPHVSELVRRVSWRT
jgi:hypothetical protein